MLASIFEANVSHIRKIDSKKKGEFAPTSCADSDARSQHSHFLRAMGVCVCVCLEYKSQLKPSHTQRYRVDAFTFDGRAKHFFSSIKYSAKSSIRERARVLVACEPRGRCSSGLNGTFCINDYRVVLETINIHI